MPPLMLFMTSDLSTGVRVATIRIGNYDSDVPLDLVNALAVPVRVSTWPGDVPVPATQTVSTFPEEQLPNGGRRAAYGQIDLTLVETLDGNGWYQVSLPRQGTDDYQVSGGVFLSGFVGGPFGVRISPAHPPVVSKVMSCANDGGTVTVSAGFSEPLTKPSGDLALDYGVPAAPCAVGDDQPTFIEFTCANATGAAPFSLHIAGTATAAASGSPMEAGTLRSADMHVWVLGNGCSYYMPPATD